MSGSSTYKVRPGDTLPTIALRQGVPLQRLSRLNTVSDDNPLYVGRVLQLEAPSGLPSPETLESGDPPTSKAAPGPLPHHAPRAPASTAPQSITPEDFLSPAKGSQSLAAIVIGCAEGNRTPRGGLVWSSFGHTDPGNGKRNLGSFSSQMTPERARIILGEDPQQRQASQLVLRKADRALSTRKGKQQLQQVLDGHTVHELLPEVAQADLEGMRELIHRADQLQLEAMRSKLPQYTAAARGAGLDANNPLLLATYFDSFNQSERASSLLLKQFPFIKAQKQGITQETMLAARVRSWIDPNTRRPYTHLDKKTHQQTEYKYSGFENIARKNKQSLTQVIQADQGRRVGEMVRALARMGGSTTASPPTKTSSSATKTQTPPAQVKPAQVKSTQTPSSSPESKGHASASSGLLSALPPRLTEVANGQRALVPGSKDSLVTQLQSLLAFSMPQWSDKLKQEWGRFGQSTQGAVSELQRANKLPSTTGAVNASTLELLKFDVYARYFQMQGAALDTRINIKTLVGLRIPTSTQAGAGKGVYDDRFALLWREGGGRKRVKEFLANTDPAGEYLAKGYGVDVDHKKGKELGRLKEGYYVYHKSTGYNGWLKGKPVLRSRGRLPIEFDVNHDGSFNKLDAIPSKNPTADDILIHAGSRHSTGSAGCMTLPPDEFQSFWASLGTQEDIKYLLVTLDGATSVQGPHPSPQHSSPATPSPVAPSSRKDSPATIGSSADRMVRAALSQAGKKYVFGAQVKLDDPDPKAFDCSELVKWAVHQAGGRITDGSQAQRKSCHDHRTILPVAQAIKTRGALLFNNHHVAISLGNGMTIEAANAKLGVTSLKAAGRGWTDAGLVPGLHYGDSAPKSSSRPASPPAQLPDQHPVSPAHSTSAPQNTGAGASAARSGVLGDVVDGHVIHAHEVRVKGTLAWRNNNPGNIRNGAFADSHGAYRGKSNHHFAVFPDHDVGFAALVSLLKTEAYRRLTVTEAMNRYAPATDHNDPAAYAQSVSKMTGLVVSKKLGSLSEGELHKFASAIQKVEGWHPGTVYAWNDTRLPAQVKQHLDKATQAPSTQSSAPATPPPHASSPHAPPAKTPPPTPSTSVPSPTVPAVQVSTAGANDVALAKLAARARTRMSKANKGACARGVSEMLSEAGYAFEGTRPTVSSGIVNRQVYDFSTGQWVDSSTRGYYVSNHKCLDTKTHGLKPGMEGSVRSATAEESAKFFRHTLLMLHFAARTPLLSGDGKRGTAPETSVKTLQALPEGAIIVFGPALSRSMERSSSGGAYAVGGHGHAGHVGVLLHEGKQALIVADGLTDSSGKRYTVETCLSNYAWAIGYVPTTEPTKLQRKDRPAHSL